MIVIRAPFENNSDALPLSPVTMIDFSSTFLPTEEESRVIWNSSSIDSEKTSPSTDATITDASTASKSTTTNWAKQIKTK